MPSRGLRLRVFPGDHENRKALSDKIFDKRIVRRKIENVVFHDPGRNDEDRFRPHLCRGRRVLDKLDEAVAIDDFPRRDRDVAADDEILAADWSFAADARSQSSNKF